MLMFIFLPCQEVKPLSVVTSWSLYLEVLVKKENVVNSQLDYGQLFLEMFKGNNGKPRPFLQVPRDNFHARRTNVVSACPSS